MDDVQRKDPSLEDRHRDANFTVVDKDTVVSLVNINGAVTVIGTVWVRTASGLTTNGTQGHVWHLT